MPRTNIITGLDIGSNEIKVLVGAQRGGEGGKEGHQAIEVMSQMKLPSFGVRRGVVVDVEKVSQIIQSILIKVKEEVGQEIHSVYVNINGSHLSSTSSRGMVAVSRADQKISDADVDRVLLSAQTISLSSNKEILETIPKEYIVDGEKGIKEPIGMEGGRLEAEVLILTGFSPYKKNLNQAILGANLQVLDIVPSPIASASAVLSPKQKELGVAILDIGAGTSGLSIFEEGNLIHLAIFPIGSSNITNDIAIGLQTDINSAEMIKIEKGHCLSKSGNKKEKIETENGSLVFSQKALTRIIEDRVSDIFEQVEKELKKISKQSLLPSGLVLTGGGANIKGIVELAKKKLKLPCQIGRPVNFLGLEDGLSYSVASGLVLEGIDNLDGADQASFGQGVTTKLRRIFRVFIP